MKKFIGLYAAFIFLVSIPLHYSHAQNSIDELDEKFHLEKTIADRLEQTLKTRLDKKYFDITVEAKVKRKNKVVLTAAPNNKAKTAEQLTVEAVQSWYAKELNARPFDLETVTITLSLADAVNPKYRDDLNTWLQYWVKANFESKGEALVTIRPSDVFVINEAASVTNLNKSGWEKIERFQNLLGLLILGFFYAAGHFFMSRSKKSTAIITPVTPQKTPALQILPSEQVAPAVPQLYQPQSEDLKTEESIRKLKAKIAWVSPNMKKQINTLIMLWLENESESYLKIAAFIEAMAESNAISSRDSNVSIPKLPDDAQMYLPKALIQLQQMTAADTLNLYQEIYVDLLSKDLSDREPLHIGFEFLTSLNTRELQSVFDSLPESYQIRLLTRLPKSVRMRYTQTTDLNKLRQILNKSLTSEDPTDQQLLLELQAWQNRQAIQANSSSDLVSKISKLRETCSEISRLEETLWVHQVTTTHPELKERLMQEEHHLCFITEWPVEKIRKFCLQTKTSDLAAAMICLPFIFDKIMSVCGEQTKKEIQVEMQGLVEPKLSARFERFVNAFDTFIENENISSTATLRDVKPKAS